MKYMRQKSLAFALVGALAISTASTASAHPLGALIRRAESARANQAVVTQEGAGNGAAVRQNGEGNTAGVIQFGRNNDATVTQNGDNNTACLVQLGRNLDGSIAQVGDNQNAGILQTRRGTRAIPTRYCQVDRHGRGFWMSALRHAAPLFD